MGRAQAQPCAARWISCASNCWQTTGSPLQVGRNPPVVTRPEDDAATRSSRRSGPHQGTSFWPCASFATAPTSAPCSTQMLVRLLNAALALPGPGSLLATIKPTARMATDAQRLPVGYLKYQGLPPGPSAGPRYTYRQNGSAAAAEGRQLNELDSKSSAVRSAGTCQIGIIAAAARRQTSGRVPCRPEKSFWSMSLRPTKLHALAPGRRFRNAATGVVAPGGSVGLIDTSDLHWNLSPQIRSNSRPRTAQRTPGTHARLTHAAAGRQSNTA